MLKLEKSMLSKLYYFCNFPLLLNITAFSGNENYIRATRFEPIREHYLAPLAMPTLFFYNLYDYYICVVADCVIVSVVADCVIVMK